MSLNWKEIDLILEELSLTSSFIQKVRQPNYHSLLLDIYKPAEGRFPVLIELASQGCRFHRLYHGVPYKKTVRLQRFAQLLRSRVQGGRIIESRQIGKERIIELQIVKGELTTILYIRLWSNAANILATDTSHTILDAFYRRPKKGEVSGKPFNPELDQSPPGRHREFSVRQQFLDQKGATPMSFNEFIELEYATETRDRLLAELTREADAVLHEEASRLEKRLTKKTKELEHLGSFQQYKHFGDLLASFRHCIIPGNHWASVPDYDHDGQNISIEIDPKKSPGDNIEHYYKKYHKAKGAYEHMLEEIEQTRNQISHIQRELLHIHETTDQPDKQIEYIHSIIARHKNIHSRSQEKREAPGLTFTSGIYTIHVGRTSKENDTLLREWTRGNDYWLHTRDYPGGYVIIKYIPGKTVPLETLLDAGNLAVYYSKARNSGRADLYYTQVKYLRRAKESKQGTVLPTHEKNLAITLDQKRLDALFTGVDHE